ncbi:hypothetical protein [Yinghuangia sp. YIM S09857]|uniref:hypothetical protein n=1 Tax=Yinghuangia sp. YIM S09857 TaxID=3436929 RepID=UPI003F5343AC
MVAGVAAACVVALAGCSDDGGGEGGDTAPGGPGLPERIGAAERIDAWDGATPNNPPDTTLASDPAVDDQGAAYRLVQEMEFLGYTDTRDWQGGYYYDEAPAAGRPGYLMVIIASAGKMPANVLVQRVVAGAEDEPNPPDTGEAFGGTYSCTASSCLWADDNYLVNILTDGLDPAAIRTLINQIRTGAPT